MNFQPLPSKAYLDASLAFDPDAGTLTWKRRPRDHFATANAWGTWNARWSGGRAFCTPNSNGYLAGTIDSHRYLAHRVIWKLLTGTDPEEIDHIDGNPTNNVPANLRSVGRSENLRNLSIRRDNSSGIAGVHWVAARGRWMVTIGNKTLGRFKAKEDAIAARERALVDGGYHQNHCRRAKAVCIGGAA